MNIETLAVHAAHTIDPVTGAIAAPIHLSTTFEREIDGTYPHGYMYTRNGNPNRDALERGVAALEDGAAAAAFASGSAATAAIFQSLSPGDHVVAQADAYYGTTRLLRDLFLRWGLEAAFVDMSDLAAVQKALQPKTKLVWIETPSNPLLKIVDIAAVTKLVHQTGALTVCDNTWAPIIQQPLALGADMVMHSTTKYFGGHCDVMGGIIVTKVEDEFFERVRVAQVSGGAVPSAFDCWLVLRGMRTLPWRMRAHSGNAMKVAAYLNDHPRIRTTYYPGLTNHFGHDIAARQMTAFGGMLSFEIRGNRESAFAFVSNLKLFTRATSLGGVESLIEHRASIEGPGTSAPEGLLRVSIGLEHSDDLIDDFARVLR